MKKFEHPIALESFALIDREIGPHTLNVQEYAIARRVIHTTADFEFKDLLNFSPTAIQSGIDALRQQHPIITDVSMVSRGIHGLVTQTFNNPLWVAVEAAPEAEPGKTRTETGMLHFARQFPNGIFVIGNAPTALLALCEEIEQGRVQPALVIGAPVGFVSVVEAKSRLAQLAVPQIVVNGRKGGSPVAAAIVNALIHLA
ncbi:cobalt-precorrin-8X methylmutase [Roseofilum reptotaenium CS-1145]|uniref:Cobalt-precorrin-8X methylmutase n=1 Tax=Roseofilum reptotaenium AO1-A TaxID=1925591 RepID=A0A1L9QT27_9CYAN|nr:cobalt-precorrin-8X methylmutase [Roseofilum reptotaenium]MDB9518224.1 cobalt-precorrin-8X methylmutase [Roseofilum reptotaenium CS-1145]OJJ25813.1 cobalt-precorrin-8X methylmutase [Roseofilum reptotaenium AO1-A]